MNNKKYYPLYCQFCGSKNLNKLIYDSAFKCPLCNRITYLNSKPSVCAVIIRNQNVLLISESDLIDKTWDLPGGFLLYGESPEDGLKRELREELNANIKVEQLLTVLIDVYGSLAEYTLNLFYKVILLSNEVQPSAEIKETKWFNIKNLPKCKYKSTYYVLSNINSYLK